MQYQYIKQQKNIVPQPHMVLSQYCILFQCAEMSRHRLPTCTTGAIEGLHWHSFWDRPITVCWWCVERRTADCSVWVCRVLEWAVWCSVTHTHACNSHYCCTDIKYWHESHTQMYVTLVHHAAKLEYRSNWENFVLYRCGMLTRHHLQANQKTRTAHNTLPALWLVGYHGHLNGEAQTTSFLVMMLSESSSSTSMLQGSTLVVCMVAVWLHVWCQLCCKLPCLKSWDLLHLPWMTSAQSSYLCLLDGSM